MKKMIITLQRNQTTDSLDPLDFQFNRSRLTNIKNGHLKNKRYEKVSFHFSSRHSGALILLI